MVEEFPKWWANWVKKTAKKNVRFMLPIKVSGSWFVTEPLLTQPPKLQITLMICYPCKKSMGYMASVVAGYSVVPLPMLVKYTPLFPASLFLRAPSMLMIEQNDICIISLFGWLIFVKTSFLSEVFWGKNLTNSCSFWQLSLITHLKTKGCSW